LFRLVVLHFTPQPVVGLALRQRSYDSAYWDDVAGLFTDLRYDDNVA
jgi:hypothetical protein